MERPAARRFTANTKSANFCATVHGYEEYVKGGKDIWYVLSHLPKACYVIAGKEVAPTTGAKHLQCYIQFDMRKKLSAVVALLKGDTQHVHVEPAMGSSDDNIKYCSKEDLEAWTWGEVNEVRVNDMITDQGKRSDIDKIREMCNSGEIKTQRDLLNKVATVGGLQFGCKFLSFMEQQPREPPRVFWFFGPTGSGKSREVHDFASKHELPLWTAPGGGSAWFDGFWGQDIALFDDFRGSDVPFHQLLRLTDRYPLQLPVKGAFTWWTPKWIFITTPKDVESTFAGHDDREDLGQLKRRLALGGEFDFGGDGITQFRELILQYIN
nr:MAG: replication associated protein [Arizlama virus]